MAHRGHCGRPLNMSIDIEIEVGPKEGALNVAAAALPNGTTRAGRAGYVTAPGQMYSDEEEEEEEEEEEVPGVVGDINAHIYDETEDEDGLAVEESVEEQSQSELESESEERALKEKEKEKKEHLG